MIIASDGNLYGTASVAGPNGYGIIFRMDPTGHHYTILHAFTGADGRNPSGDLVEFNGAFYGTTSRGGTYDAGVLFRIDPSGNYTILHTFWLFTGALPLDGISLGPDGCLYGTTYEGGPNDQQHASYGTVFKFDLTAGQYSVLHAFKMTGNHGFAAEGMEPMARVIVGQDGYLYGTTNNCGSVEVQAPGGGLVFANNLDTGTLFKLARDGTGFTVLHTFQPNGSASDGGQPQARLVQAANGMLYGTTAYGGVPVVPNPPPLQDLRYGTVFGINPDGSGYVTHHSFGGMARDSSGGVTIDGVYPYGGLIQGQDGYLYGTAAYNGGYNYGGDISTGGIVYRISTTSNDNGPYDYTALHSFGYKDINGSQPWSNLVQGNDASIYGTAINGGVYDVGTVFKMSPAGVTYALHTFGNPIDNPNGPGLPPSTVHLQSLTLNPISVVGGHTSLGTVTLDGPAPVTGAVITLASNSASATVPAQVVVYPNTTTSTFLVATNAVSVSTNATITASYNASSLPAILTIAPPSLVALTVDPGKVTSGANSLGTVSLSGPAPTGGLVVNLTSADTNTVTVPPVVRIPAGSSGASFLAATSQVGNTTTVTLTAQLNTITQQASLSVLPGLTTTPGLLADASVQAGSNAYTNYGTQPLLLVEKITNDASNDNNACAYLKFDLNNLRIAPTCATLKLSVTGASTPASGIATLRVYGISNSSWTETGITWNNAPSLNTGNFTGGGTLITSVDVPLQTGIAAFDVTSYVKTHLGQAISFLVIDEATDSLQLAFASKEAGSGHPVLLLTSSFLNDVPPPFWALHVLPTDGAGSGGGPSSSDSVNLASGVEENTPGADILGRNPLGPSAVFSRYYRSVLAAKGYASPGLSLGWTHNYDLTVSGVTGAWMPLTLAYPNGAQEVWTPNLDANANPTGILSPPTNSGVPYLVEGVPSPNVPGRWLLLWVTFKDLSTLTFTPDPNNADLYLLTRQTNAVGRSLSILYDSSHCLQKVVDDSTPSNTLLAFQYQAGYLSSITDNYGRQVTFTFSPTAGTTCLTGVSQINSANLQWQYGYTAVNGWPFLSSVGVPDPTGGAGIRSHPITYGPDGRVASLVDANGNQRLYTYGTSTQVQVLDPNNTPVESWTQSSGSLNNDTGTTDAANKSDQVLYQDPANPYRATSYINRNNQQVWATYDQYGNLTSQTAPSNGNSVVVHYNYDYTFLALGQLSSVQQNGMAGTVTYTYYPNGLVNTIISPLPGGGNGPSPVVTYYYSALGNVTKITGPAPNNSGGLVAVTYNYVFDPGDPVHNVASAAQTEALGEPLTVTDPMGAVTHYRYDARGNCIAVIDALGNETDFVFNICDQLTSTILPATGQTGTGRAHTDISYLYPGGPAISTIAYDESNTPVRTVGETLGKEGEGLADTGNTELSSSVYDAQSRVTQLKDGNGHAFGHVYDNVGNLTSLSFPMGDSLHGQFDPEGNLTRFTNARSQNQTFSLAPDDSRLTSVTHDSGTVEHYTYDMFDRTTEVSDGSTTLDYTYDDLGLLTSESVTYAAVSGLPFTLNYFYNPDGSLSALSMPMGTISYTYDLDGRLTDISYPWQNGSYHYDYDLNGRLIHKQTAFTDTTYHYNALGQLLQLTNRTASPNLALLGDYSQFHYDGAGNLLSATVTMPSLSGGQNSVGTLSYTYDTQDRLTRELSQRNLAIPSIVGAAGNYDYASASDAADNLSLLRGITQTSNTNNQLIGDSLNSAYTYDLDGNPTTQEGRSLQYDDEGHLTAYSDTHLGTYLHMGYRPDGLRAWFQSVSGQATYFVYSGDRLLFEINAGGPNGWQYGRCYGWGAAGLEQVSVPTNGPVPITTSYVFDPLGNVASRLDGGGALLDQSFYDGFGKLIGDWQNGTGLFVGGQDVVVAGQVKMYRI